MSEIYRYGLLGNPLGHSFSPAYFKQLFERLGLADTHVYDLFALQAEEIPALLARPDIRGLNVTIPYKRILWPYMVGAGAAAKALGAVNVLRRKDGGWWGENTDVIGFEQSLCRWLAGRPGGFAPEAARNRLRAAVVLGDGGASAAVQYVLGGWGLPFDVVTRRPLPLQESGHGRPTPAVVGAAAGDGIAAMTPARSYLTYEQFQASGGFQPYGLCVQTTPVGMHPDVAGELPLPYETLDVSPARPFFFYDVVYNPEPTAMMRRMAAAGAEVKGGLEMLHLQAEAAWRIWQA